MEKSELELLYLVMVETDPDHILFLSNRRRTRSVVERKQMLAAVARHFGATCQEVLNYIGWRNHTSVLWAVKQTKGYMEVYPVTRQRFETICEEYEFRKTMGLLAGNSIH